MSKINFSPENVSRIFQKAVDEAIEQHRIQGNAIAQTDEHGNVIEIQPADITPRVEKLEQRQQQPTQKPLIK